MMKTLAKKLPGLDYLAERLVKETDAKRSREHPNSIASREMMILISAAQRHKLNQEIARSRAKRSARRLHLLV